MPTNPVSPNTEAAIDRLTLGVDSPRGGQPHFMGGCMVPCACFEAEPNGVSVCTPVCACFEAEASGVIPGIGLCGCFEGE